MSQLNSKLPNPRTLDLVVSLLLIVVIWQSIVWITEVPSYILPGPLSVAKAMVEYAGLIAEHSWITALEVLIGLFIGTLLGVLTALYLMVSDVARRFMMPILVISQTLPVFALAPLLTLWFGYGLLSKIMMTLLIIYLESKP